MTQSGGLRETPRDRDNRLRRGIFARRRSNETQHNSRTRVVSVPCSRRAQAYSRRSIFSKFTEIPSVYFISFPPPLHSFRKSFSDFARRIARFRVVRGVCGVPVCVSVFVIFFFCIFLFSSDVAKACSRG